MTNSALEDRVRALRDAELTASIVSSAGL